MQISMVMLIVLLFSDQILGGQKSLRGELLEGGHALYLGRKQATSAALLCGLTVISDCIKMADHTDF